MFGDASKGADFLQEDGEGRETILQGGFKCVIKSSVSVVSIRGDKSRYVGDDNYKEYHEVYNWNSSG